MDAALSAFGLPAIFVVLAVKAAGVPLPLPADVIMLAAAARAADGTFVLSQVFVVLLVALVIGGAGEFVLARGPGRRLVYRLGRYVGLSPVRLDLAANTVRRGGVAGIAVSLMTPGVNATTNAAAGLAGLPWRVFLPGLALGSAGDVALHLAVGYTGGAVADRVLRTIPLPFAITMLTLALVCGLGVWVALHHRHHPHLPANEKLGAALRAWHRTGTPVLVVWHWLWRRVTPRHLHVPMWGHPPAPAAA